MAAFAKAGPKEPLLKKLRACPSSLKVVLTPYARLDWYILTDCFLHKSNG